VSPPKWLIVCCRIALGIGVVIAFFVTAPWLNSRSLSDLPAEYRNQVPAWAKSFTLDHDNLVFNGHGTIRQEPVQFALRLGALLALLGASAASMRFPRQER
jgi:hypothetical protein